MYVNIRAPVECSKKRVISSELNGPGHINYIGRRDLCRKFTAKVSGAVYNPFQWHNFKYHIYHGFENKSR